MITDAGVASAVQTLYGYRGRPIDTPFNIDTSIFTKAEDVTQAMLDSGRIRYLIAWMGFDRSKITATLTPLLDIGPNENMRGTGWTAFYVGDLPQRLNVVYGDQVVLRGFSLSQQNVCPGDNVTVQFTWGAKNTPTLYYVYYMHLYSRAMGELSYPINGDALAIGDRPAISWTRPDELIVGQRRTWAVPPDLAPGDYELQLGVFEPVSDLHLTLPDGKNAYTTATIRVMNCTWF